MEQRPLSRLESVECATSELAFPLLPVQELQLKDVEQRAAVVDVETRLDVERDAGVALVERPRSPLRRWIARIAKRRARSSCFGSRVRRWSLRNAQPLPTVPDRWGPTPMSRRQTNSSIQTPRGVQGIPNMRRWITK